MLPNKKLIIYIGNFELPDKNAAAQRVIANGKIFRDLGYKVVFIGVTKDSRSHDILNTKENYFGFDSWSVSYPSSKIQWFKQIIIPIGLETIISQYPNNSLHAVISYNYPAIAQYRIKSICKKNNAHLIPDITEWPASSGRGIIVGIIKTLDTFLRMQIFNNQADALITTSYYLTKYYRNSVNHIIELPTLYDSKPLEVIPANNLVDDGTTVRLLYAGNPFGENITYKTRAFVKDRLDKVIALLSNLMEVDFKLDIYGVTKNRYLEVYPEHNSLLMDMDRKVIFHGRKPYQEIISSIKESHFTMFFRDIVRLTEAGFPSKLSESITAGTPVITNMISNLEPYLQREKNIYLIDLEDEHKQIIEMQELLSLSIKDISIKKQECIDSKTFDYRSYISPMKYFLQSLSKLSDDSK